MTSLAAQGQEEEEEEELGVAFLKKLSICKFRKVV